MSNFSSAHEREAFVAKYGELHTGILDQCLGLITATANHTLSETEARTKALAMFEDLMQFHVPACHATIAEYQARVNAQQKVEAENRVAYIEKQQRIRDAEAKFQRQAVEAADRAQREAYDRSQKELQEAREKVAAEQRAAQDRADQVEAEKAAELERRLQAVGGAE